MDHAPQVSDTCDHALEAAKLANRLTCEQVRRELDDLERHGVSRFSSQGTLAEGPEI